MKPSAPLDDHQRAVTVLLPMKSIVNFGSVFLVSLRDGRGQRRRTPSIHLVYLRPERDGYSRACGQSSRESPRASRRPKLSIQLHREFGCQVSHPRRKEGPLLSKCQYTKRPTKSKGFASFIRCGRLCRRRPKTKPFDSCVNLFSSP